MRSTSSSHGARILPPLRVASVPADHPYVRHLSSPDHADGVERLPDPPVPGAPAGQWWPSPVLEPSWLRGHASAFDLVHVHFGFEHLGLRQLDDVVATLRALHVPLVLTVHDLVNPHLHDQRPHVAALGRLARAAAAVVTLTPGAGREIARRWGVQAHVLPHPHVVPLARLGRPRRPHDGFVVALHDKPRAGNDPDAVRVELTRAVTDLPGGRVHPGHRERLDDDTLWDHLGAVDALVLPYRAATHSGFLEACHDLGTNVVAARTGFLTEQHPHACFDLDRPGSLTAALRSVHAAGAPAAADREHRRRQRRALAAAHEQLYRAVLAGALGEAA
jgi:hypothetical protein